MVGDRGHPRYEEDGRVWAEGLEQQLPTLYHPVHMRALVQVDVGVQDQHDAASRQPARPSAPLGPDVHEFQRILLIISTAGIAYS